MQSHLPEPSVPALFPERPADRNGFDIAIICALPLEAEAVTALFDCRWDQQGSTFDKVPGDPNTYSAGVIGRHNVILVHMPAMGVAPAAVAAASCRASFPNIRLALVVGICGGIPLGSDGREIVLGDVVISSGAIHYDFGRQLPRQFLRKNSPSDSLSCPNSEIRALLAKLEISREREQMREITTNFLQTLHAKPYVQAHYPGVEHDKLFEPTYCHLDQNAPCEQAGCSGNLVQRVRLASAAADRRPDIHFGLIASGKKVMKSGEDRDTIACTEGVIAFEMEGAGVWSVFPCVIIKGVCDYADSHKIKLWQRYAAATAAAAAKTFLSNWVPRHDAGLQQLPENWFIVPYKRNESFVGRVSILEELKRLIKSTPAHTRAALYGLGGIGKTQIALEYAFWARNNYPKMSVFWAHASNLERFTQSMMLIARECNIPGHDDPKLNTVQLVKTWLERKNQRPWLLIIDNADDINMLFSSSDKLVQYIPSSPNGTIILTTRNKQVGVKFTKLKRRNLIEIGRMSIKEAEELLRDGIGDSLDLDDASAITSRLEAIPLALVQASAYIQENSISVKRYLNILNESDSGLIQMLSEDFEVDGRDLETPSPVAETWILSFEQIKRQLPLAADILSVISYYDRQNIPMDFVLTAYKIIQKRQYGVVNSQDTSDQKMVEEALCRLKGYSLLENEINERFNINRLVQLVTRRWLNSREWHNEYMTWALISVSENYPFGKYESRVTCADYLPHALSVLALQFQPQGVDIQQRVSLLHNVAGFMSYQGKWRAAEDYILEAVKIKAIELGPENPSTLTSMGNLASTYSNQGRWKEAEDLEAQVMKTSKTVLGAEHPDTLTSMANLASTYRNQGRWTEAEDLEVQVMKTRKTVLGAEHPGTLTSMANLASTYMNQGRWKEAEDLNVQVMKTRKTVLGAEHPHTLTSMSNLASTYRNQGRWKEAEDLEVQAMKTSKTVLGAEHPDTLTSMANLASTYSNQGRWKEAEDLEVQVMKTSKTVLGAEHPDTLTCMANLASTFWNQSRWKEAEDLFVQVMKTRKTVLGAEHPDTLTSMANLASKYRNQGRLKDAEDLEVEVMKRRKTVLGAENLDMP